MSYQPFNQKAPGYTNPPGFTPWSQSVGGFLPGNSGLPFKNSPFSPFSSSYSPYHPLLIHQQNNFYNSNFTLSPNPTFTPPPFINAANLKAYHKYTQAKQRKHRPNEVIVISDDDQQPAEAKPMVAVVREKTEAQLTRPQGQDRTLQNIKQQKQVIQAKRHPEIRQEPAKAEPRPTKKPSKAESIKEEEIVAKKKKISKERSGYKLTQHLRELMELSRYREYRPDLIMVGPQFQVKIDEQTLLKDRQDWLHELKESLQLRRHE